MGFGLDFDAIHSPNECFGIFNYLKGIETIPLFYKCFIELSKELLDCKFQKIIFWDCNPNKERFVR